MMGVRGPTHPAWKGDAATAQAKNHRARVLFSIEGKRCEGEGCTKPAEHRHHRNGDPGDNRPENIAFVCVIHHQLIHHPPQPPKPCVNCGKLAKPLRRGRCQACAAYLGRTGVERPWKEDGRREGASVYHPRPIPGPQPCSHCGAQSKPHWKGRCRRCYDYWRLHGKQAERPI